MKNLFKLFTVLLCGIASVTLTSCLNSDNEDTSIDVTTQKTYQSAMSGSYSGKIRFWKPSDKASQLVRYDSLDAMCYVKADSTIQLSAYGGSKKIINCLDSAIIADGSNAKYKDLFEALRNANTEAEKISMYYYIPNTNCVQSNSLSFITTLMIEKKLTYGDATHYVYFYFEPYSYGYWASSSSRSLSAAMYLRYVYEADSQKTISQLASMTPLSSSYYRTIYISLALK